MRQYKPKLVTLASFIESYAVLTHAYKCVAKAKKCAITEEVVKDLQKLEAKTVRLRLRTKRITSLG